MTQTKIQLSKDEIETTIGWNKGDKEAEINTTDESVKQRLARFGAVPYQTDGPESFYLWPIKLCLPRKQRRKLTDAEKQARQAALKKAREAKP